MPISIYLQSCLAAVETGFLKLNMFQTGIQDESIIRNERRSTRLFLALLSISVVIIGFYYSIIQFRQTIQIRSPSIIEYSNLPKEVSLQCPCTNAAVKYEEFVNMTPFYHELCQSDFVSDQFIDRLYSLYEQTLNTSISTDAHRIAVFQFETLRTLCQLANKTINDSLETFLQNGFVQTHVVAQETLENQIKSLRTDFINVKSKTFLRTLKSIQNVTAQSLFMTGASVTSVKPRTQFRIGFFENLPYPGINYTFKDGSSCTCSSSTANNCMGLATLNNNTVPGFQTGCYMLSALLNSTLEVCYNQTYINTLTNSSDEYQKLDDSNSYPTVEALLSRMFITHWSHNASFERYFNHCAPTLCQYTVTSMHNFWVIIITLIGFFGGLSSIFRIIAPLLITKLWPIIRKLITRRRTAATQPAETDVNTVLSVNQRLKRFFGLIKKKLIDLNLFQSVPPTQDENILRRECYTTRLYIILLIISFIIFTIFTSIEPQTIHVTSETLSPEQFNQLYQKYPQILDCPCTQTTIDYRFICSIKPQYHEVCSSKFVSPKWITIEFVKSSMPNLSTEDFRYQSQFHFQLLSTLCQMAEEIVQDSLQSFNRTKFVTNKLINNESFQTQIDSIVEDFKKSLPPLFQRVVQLIETNFEINQFITPMNSEFDCDKDNDEESNTYIHLKPFAYKLIGEPLYFGHFNSTQNYTSFSSTVFEFYRQTVIKENEIKNIIPGMAQSWFPFQALLVSTLECFYNETCLSYIKRYINSTQSSINITTLKSSSLNNNQYDRIETLVNDLFIRSWDNESDYQSYFNQCRPLTCQYSYKSRLNFIYITTKIIGFMGGVNVALCLLLPFIVKLLIKLWNHIFQRQRNNSSTVRVSVSIRIRFWNYLQSLWISSKKYIEELNLYPIIPPSTDSQIIRRRRHTTRIYLILLITALFILVIYTSLNQETVTDSVPYPSLPKYEELLVQYPITLQCPCNRITIKFKEFISQIEPQYHEICSSVFVSQEWFDSMPADSQELPDATMKDDFRHILRMQFQTLLTLCRVSQNTLNASLSVFKETDLITTYAISRADFDNRTKTAIEQFKSTTSNQFIETFKLIQAINHANQLATLFYSNWVFFRKYPDKYAGPFLKDELINVLTRPEKYGIHNCSCGIQSNCSKLSEFRFATSEKPLPGFFRGCMMFDSLLQSTLTCLYNKTCLGFMRASILDFKPLPVKVLSYSSLAMSNATIETLLNHMFVSQWFQNISFDLYYNQCAPRSCEYSYALEYNSLYVITTLIALFGGLTNGLHFLVKVLAIIVYKIVDWRKKKRQVAADLTSSDITMNNENNEEMSGAVSISITTTAVQVNITSAEEQRHSEKMRRERRMLIGLILLSIVAIEIVSVILFMTRNKEQQMISTTIQTITKTSSNFISEPTSTNICHMTLKYQSQTYPTGPNPISMVTGDFNRDGIDDLALTNADSDTISVLLGNNDGKFQARQNFSTGHGSRPRQILTGDFDNDTFLDLVIYLAATNKIVIFYGSGSNSLFIPSTDIFLYGPRALKIDTIAVVDINSDGFVDIVVSSIIDEGSRFEITGDVNMGNRYHFIFRRCSCDFITGTVISVVVAELDNDARRNDMAWLISDGLVLTRSAYEVRGYLELKVLADDKLYKDPSTVVTGRFNDDEFVDLALISSQSDTLQVLLRFEDKQLSKWKSIQMIYSTNHNPTSIARINFNNDTIDDLAILNCNGTVTIFIGSNDGLFERKDLYFGTHAGCTDKCCQSLKVVNLNRDGRDDLVFIDTGMNSIQVALSLPCNE
ncbi:unnamed protein product [Adineta steineri]|uniref:Uncharacterized protein n=1 Tax=Adineta steineri TaxID=433720 RepID=A0A814RNE1_9BILA|nr:unnamed protein product [Adineta steineri]CAF3940886.1 unnamed protein product [Adineta steineri]